MVYLTSRPLRDWQQSKRRAELEQAGCLIMFAAYTPRQRDAIMVDGVEVDALRYIAKGQQARFIKMLGTLLNNPLYDQPGFHALGINQNEWVSMTEWGAAPAELDVHHRMPLGGSGTLLVQEKINDFSNFILLPTGLHRKIHDYINLQTTNLVAGETRLIELPVLPGAYYHPSQHQTAAPDAIRAEISREDTALGHAVRAGTALMELKSQKYCAPSHAGDCRPMPEYDHRIQAPAPCPANR